MLAARHGEADRPVPVGEPIGRHARALYERERVFYQAFAFRGRVFQPGDVVRVRSDRDDEHLIALVEQVSVVCVREVVVHGRWLVTRWDQYLMLMDERRVRTVHADHDSKLWGLEDELFFTDHQDTFPATCVIGPCEVVFETESDSRLDVAIPPVEETPILSSYSLHLSPPSSAPARVTNLAMRKRDYERNREAFEARTKFFCRYVYLSNGQCSKSCFLLYFVDKGLVKRLLNQQLSAAAASHVLHRLRFEKGVPSRRCVVGNTVERGASVDLLPFRVRFPCGQYEPVEFDKGTWEPAPLSRATCASRTKPSPFFSVHDDSSQRAIKGTHLAMGWLVQAQHGSEHCSLGAQYLLGLPSVLARKFVSPMRVDAFQRNNQRLLARNSGHDHEWWDVDDEDEKANIHALMCRVLVTGTQLEEAVRQGHPPALLSGLVVRYETRGGKCVCGVITHATLEANGLELTVEDTVFRRIELDALCKGPPEISECNHLRKGDRLRRLLHDHRRFLLLLHPQWKHSEADAVEGFFNVVDRDDEEGTARHGANCGGGRGSGGGGGGGRGKTKGASKAQEEERKSKKATAKITTGAATGRKGKPQGGRNGGLIRGVRYRRPPLSVSLSPSPPSSPPSPPPQAVPPPPVCPAPAPSLLPHSPVFTPSSPPAPTPAPTPAPAQTPTPAPTPAPAPDRASKPSPGGLPQLQKSDSRRDEPCAVKEEAGWWWGKLSPKHESSSGGSGSESGSSSGTYEYSEESDEEGLAGDKGEAGGPGAKEGCVAAVDVPPSIPTTPSGPVEPSEPRKPDAPKPDAPPPAKPVAATVESEVQRFKDDWVPRGKEEMEELLRELVRAIPETARGKIVSALFAEGGEFAALLPSKRAPSPPPPPQRVNPRAGKHSNNQAHAFARSGRLSLPPHPSGDVPSPVPDRDGQGAHDKQRQPHQRQQQQQSHVRPHPKHDQPQQRQPRQGQPQRERGEPSVQSAGRVRHVTNRPVPETERRPRKRALSPSFGATNRDARPRVVRDPPKAHAPRPRDPHAPIPRFLAQHSHARARRGNGEDNWDGGGTAGDARGEQDDLVVVGWSARSPSSQPPVVARVDIDRQVFRPEIPPLRALQAQELRELFFSDAPPIKLRSRNALVREQDRLQLVHSHLDPNPKDSGDVAFTLANGQVRLMTVEMENICLGRYPNRASRVTWSNNGRVVAAACVDGAVCIYDADEIPRGNDAREIIARESASPVRTLLPVQGTGSATYCCMSTVLPNGVPSHACAAYTDGSVYLWDIESGRRQRWTAHNGKAAMCSISPENADIASVGDDGCLRMWDLAQGRVKAVAKDVHGPGLRVFSCRFLAHSREIVTTGTDGVLRIWDTRSLSRCARAISVPQARFSADAIPSMFSPHLIACYFDSVLLALDCADEAVVQFDTDTSHIHACGWVSNAAFITADKGGSVVMWECPV